LSTFGLKLGASLLGIFSITLTSVYARTPQPLAKSSVSAPVTVASKPTKKAKRPAGRLATMPPPPPVVEAPPVPLRPSQLPAVAPRVSYQNGQLTIIAENSTMGDVISAVRNATGIKIETIGAPSRERIATKIGPAPVRDVLLSLMQGSQYDYFILGSATEPDRIESVMLTPRSAANSTSANAAGSNARSANPTYDSADVPEDNESDDEESSEGFAPAEQQQPAQNPNQGAQVPGQPVPAGPTQPGQLQQPGTKTPEQLLEELRRMEQQRNSGQPPPNPRDRNPRDR
jgi:hypothetical protein